MFTIFCLVISSLCRSLRSRAVLQAEILALRHQLLVLQRSVQGRRLRLRAADRIFWVLLSRLWQGWRSAVKIMKGISTLLDMEEPGTQGQTLPTARDSRTDPQDQLGQLARS